MSHPSLQRLSAAIKYVQKHHPLPRCSHGNCLRDHSGAMLLPDCGCTYTPPHLAHSQAVTPQETENLKSFIMSLHVILFEHGLLPKSKTPRERISNSNTVWLIQHYAACPFCWMDAHPEAKQ